MKNNLKILLINPPITKVIDPSLPAVLLEEEDPMPPLGLMYLASYLEKYSEHRVKILDCQIEKIDFPALKEKIQEEQPDIAGITTMTFTLLDVLRVVEIIKNINPEIKVVLGGPHAHIFPEETGNLAGVNFLVLGEGERTFAELLANLDDWEQLKKIKGLVFKDSGGQIINTGYPELIADLDSLPFPARRLTAYQKYQSSLAKNFPVTTMFTSRGCPYHCLFCDRPHLGARFRARSAAKVVEEMAECQKMGIKEIFIYDDTFAVDRQRVLDICRLLKEQGIKISWDIRTRVNTVDEEVLTALKEAGCQRIHYGVEAGTEKILNVLRKGITLEMAKKAFSLTRKAGIQTLAYFMIGSPDETREDILATIKFAKKLNPDFVHFTIATPYPATDLYRLGLEKKILPRDYWREFAQNPTVDFKPLVWEENLSRAELLELLEKAYRSFYFRPSYILRKIKELNSFREFIAKFKMALKLLKI